MILPALLLAASAFAQNPLDNKISVTAAPGLEFHAICKASKIPCALELDAAASGGPGQRRPFRVENLTVSQAMHQAILLYPGHRWRFRKGVIFVTPNEPDPGTPLDKPLGKEKFELSLDSARDEFGPAAGFCSVPRGEAPKEEAKTLSFTVPDATPRAVLTALVFKLYDGAWILTRAPSAGGRALYCLDLVDYKR